jgi:hypothetical protein
MTQAQSKTFMLLPDYMHKPNHNIHLGTLLSLSDDTKLPDPDLPLNEKTLISIAQENILTVVHEPWLFTNDQTFGGNLGLTAELPVFSPIGGGLVVGRSKTENLSIRCDRVETTRFVATNAYLAKSLAAEAYVQEYCRQTWRPSVYLVTGLMVAHNAAISSTRSKSHETSIGPSVDATAAGVPLKVGMSIEMADAQNHEAGNTVREPFILAYQLRRLKLKGDGSLRKDKSFNNYALFDDTDPDLDTDRVDSFELIWEDEQVLPSTVHAE